MLKAISVFCACLLLVAAVDLFVPGDEKNVYSGAVRLHVIAESNSDEDQCVKYLVRDAILKNFGDVFNSLPDTVSARETAIKLLPEIENTANSVLIENGFDYKAAVEFGKENYPTRVYGDITLPAGEYYSLRVCLGEAKGENWWCVLFPPLCSSASKDLTPSGVNKRSQKVFTDKKYIFRLKILELFGG